MRTAILMNCSPVLEGFLLDGDGDEEPVCIDMTADDPDEVAAFLHLASLTSYDSKGGVVPLASGYCTIKLVTSAAPLVRKYDAKGLLNTMKAAVNATPDPKAICAIVSNDAVDAGIGWMTTEAKAVLLEFVSTPTGPAGTKTRQNRIESLPLKVLQELFEWAMHVAIYRQGDVTMGCVGRHICKKRKP